MTATYPERHLDPAEAIAYRSKFERSALRRLSHRRETKILAAAMAAATDRMPEVLRSDESPVLLDLPCGAGRFSRLFRSHSKTYVAADHSPHMLEICRNELEQAHALDAARFEVADARVMPFADDTFDIACCVRLLHHFRDACERVQILREFHRVSVGPLVMTFLDAESPKQWVHSQRLALAKRRTRRVLLSHSDLASEAEQAGWRLQRTWSLSGLFSGQSVALLDRRC